MTLAADSGRRLGLALLLVSCTEDIQLAPDQPQTMSRASADSGTCSETLSVGPMTAQEACADPLARLFRYALCSCEDVTFSAAFETISPPTTAAPAASLGGNGRFVALAPLDIAGSWISSGANDCTLTDTRAQVAGNFKTAGNLKVLNSKLTIEHDLWVQGRISAAGALRVAGVTYQPPGRVSTGDFTLEGGVRSQAFNVAPPCACAERAAIDFTRVASQFAEQNAAPLGARAEIACGRYRLASGPIAGARWRVLGRVALFVDGDLELTDSFQPELGSSGTLDVFIRGALTLAPGVEVGSLERPGALRFFVGGASKLVFTGGTTFAAQLYAPMASVSVVGEQSFHGSLHVANYAALSHTAIHFDAADGCGEPADCAKDADCEDPLLCMAGKCGH